MAGKNALMATGMAAGQAALLGYDTSTNVVGAGTNQATATALAANFVIVTTAPSSTGVVLMGAGNAGIVALYNKGINTLQVYGNGSDTINAIAGSTGVSVPTAKSIILVSSNNAWIGNVSA